MVLGFVWIRVGSLRRESGRQVNSGSRRYIRAWPWVVGIILVYAGSLIRAYGSSCSF